MAEGDHGPIALKRYRDAAGQEVTCSFIADADRPSPPGSPFLVRELTSTNGQLPGAFSGLSKVIQRRLVSPVNADRWQQSDLLDMEIRIGLQLIRVFGDGQAYPAELSRLIGYDIDADQPFVLLAPDRGESADRAVRRLKLEQELRFEAGLLRAIRLLEVAGVVHGRISPATVRWDDVEETVQITDFSHASMAGGPRRRTGEPPWSAPEQVSGTGIADPRDDVWSAGQVIYYVITGRHARTAGEPPEPSPRAAALQGLLGNAFALSAEARPYSRELLAKLKVPDPWPAGAPTVDPRFVEGQRTFDAKRAHKFGESAKRTAANQARPQGPSGASGTPAAKTAGAPGAAKRKPPAKRGLRGWFRGPSLIIGTFIGHLFALRIS
jgi:Protein kinase domain